MPRVGNLTERVDRLGRKLVFEYDNLYRTTAEKWYDGINLVRTLSFSYDAAGQLLTADDPAAAYEFDYDLLGRVTSELQTLGGLAFDIEYQSEYDANSRRTELLAILDGQADFKNTYLYDNLNRLTVLKQESGASAPAENVVAEKRIDFAYNAASQFDTISRYADLSGSEFVANTFFAYDGMGRLASLIHSTDATAPSSGWGTDPLAGYAFSYDAASRITAIDSYVDGLTEYDYDNTSQLTGADHTGQTDENYSYDENGNRTMSGYSTTDNNQLATDGVYNYTYDDEGNRLTKTSISTGEKEEYAWDHRNRLAQVAFKDSGGTITKAVDFIYDAFNRLIRRTIDPDGATGSAALVDSFFSWEANQINLQFDGSDASDLTSRDLWNPAAIDQILAVEDVTSLLSAGDIKWPFTDHLGTPRDLASYDSGTDETTIENHRVFDSFGQLTSETNASFTISIGFTGVYFDATTGLNYHRARWLDLRTARWMSEDPIGFGGEDPNVLRYVGNSPVSATDPTGLFTKEFWEWLLFSGDISEQQKKDKNSAAALKLEMYLETGASTSGQMYSAKLAGELPGQALDSAETTVFELAQLAIPGPIDDCAVDATRFGRGAANHADEAAGLLTYTKRVVRIGHDTPWSQMTKAQRGAFKHSYMRHAKEFGLPNWKESQAEELQKKFNLVVGYIRDHGTIIPGVKKLFNGKMVQVQYFEYAFGGKKYYYYETLHGQFISAGLDCR